MQDWGELDFAGVLDWLGANNPGLPLLCVGHSAGGQVVGLADNASRLAGFLGVACQSGYWRHWEPKYWPRLLALWYLVLPLGSRLLGQVPGALTGGEPLPGGIARQWASWCRNSAYICDAGGAPWRPHFAELKCPALFYAVADDGATAPQRAVEALAAFYSGSAVGVETLDPRALGLSSLGHFGFFRRGKTAPLWQRSADWLLARTGA
jgi:predicted alpha/beta hydrolase